MNGFTQELARFVVETEIEDLPRDVVSEAKRLILDCIACALAGKTSDKGKIPIELSRMLSGPPESSIIGTSYRVSAPSAAFANGELTNALDYDVVEITHGHFAPFVIPALWSVAESSAISGKDLILATVLGCEIAVRLRRAMTPRMEVIDPEQGEVKSSYGESFQLCAASAAVGKILKLDQEKIAHVLGIAGKFCPIPGSQKGEKLHQGLDMIKYGSAGWISMTAVIAAMLAKLGYMGPTTIFDGEYGFWRMYGYGKWEPEKAMEKIGETWFFLGVGYKPYPCWRCMHGPLDCFVSIIDKNNITTEEIDGITVFGNPEMLKGAHVSEIKHNVEAQFNARYIFSCAAHRIRLEDWQIWDTMSDAKILKFMNKVSIKRYPDWKELTQKDRKRLWGGAVEVSARGKTFREERMYPKGTALPGFEMTDIELVDKFRSSASSILTQDKIDAAIKYLLELESVEDVRELMKQVTQ